jgi:beta-fructofuranosidase
MSITRDWEKPVYPCDEAGQRAALAQDPQLKAFVAARERLKGDRYRPRYHFLKPSGALNDPNGLCRWKGRWHLFYQDIVHEPEGRTIYWGHAVSDDLIHWSDLPRAIYPGPEAECWSGATWVEDDRVIAMYFSFGPGEGGIMVAESRDPLLLNWRKLGDGPVISPSGGLAGYRVYDPCIWREPDGYYALSGRFGAHPETGRRVRKEFLFRSEDLVHWEYLHPFVEGEEFGAVGQDGACPYFLPIGDRHILLHYNHMGMPQYVIGRYDRERHLLIPHNQGQFSHVANTLTAPSAAQDGSGGIYVLFNMNEHRDAGEWSGIVTLPRRLSLRGRSGSELEIRPAGDIESLRGREFSVPSAVLNAGEEFIVEGISGDCLEILASFEVPAGAALELRVLRSENAEEHTAVRLYKGAGLHYLDRETYDGGWNTHYDSVLALDTRYGSLSQGARLSPPDTADVDLEDGETITLRIFVDRSVVEAFVNDRQCVCKRVYPERTDSREISLIAWGTDIRMLRFRAWPIESIYDCG